MSENSEVLRNIAFAVYDERQKRNHLTDWVQSERAVQLWSALSRKFDWIKFNVDVDKDDKVQTYVDIFADHHMLSSFRTCEAYFYESILNSRTGRGRAWGLSFGDWFHRSLELFDKIEKTPNGWHLTNCSVADWLVQCAAIWDELKMEEFKETKRYKDIGGWQGAQLLILQYWEVYGDGKERLRTVATEIGFGKNREVPIGFIIRGGITFRFYLTGRIDRLIDNGQFIGPMDRKTTAYFNGTESSKFKPQEGMEGYVIATQAIIDSVTDGEATRSGRLCNSIIIDHVSVREPKEGGKWARFKRSIKNFTPSEIQEFKERQHRTFTKIVDILEGARPDWNTSICNNMYFHECPFKAIHEQPPENRPIIINANYTQREPWSPYSDNREEASE